MERWAGRVAIVTGASAGIGEAIARSLAVNGLKVVAVARRIDRLHALAKETNGEIHALQGDVTQEEDVVRVVKWTRETLGGADVLVNNAGVYYPIQFADLDTQKLRTTIDVNVLGLCFFTREVLKDMRDRGVNDGHIFNIGSIAGQRMIDYPEAYAYSSTKHAVRVLTEGLRRELNALKTKIRVTEISPGAVRSEILCVSGMSPEDAKKYFDENPVLEPEDIANALLYALGAPPHVQVHEIMIYPTGQDI